MRLIKKIPFTLVCDATNNTVPTTNFTKAINGKLLGVKWTTPAAVDTSATSTLTVKDGDGSTVYTKGTVAAATTTNDNQDTNHVPYQFPLAETVTITATISANQTVARNITGYLYVDSYL